MAVPIALVVLSVPGAALADWPQFQGDGAHQGLIDDPGAPLAVAWSRSDIELEGPNTRGGLSAPVIAEDGTIVAVAPTAVVGFSLEDGAGTFETSRDFGPSSQPAVAEGSDGPIVVFTEGFGDDAPVGTATPSPSPAVDDDEEGAFDSHLRAVDLGSGEDVWPSPVQLDDVVQTPVAVDADTAYVGDVGGRVTAVDLASGEVRWTVELATPIAGAIGLDGDRAIAITLGDGETPSEIVALDTGSGDEVWTGGLEAVSNVVSAAVVADGRVLALDALGGIVALDAEDGSLLWRSEVINPRAQRPFFWQGVGGPAPVSANGEVFAVDVTGRVYAFDAETGAERWDHALNDPSPVSPPVLTEAHVLVPTDSGLLYAIDRETGHLAFRVDAGGTLLRGVADAGDVLIAVTGLDDARLVALEADPDASLIDEPSPTTVNVGRMLAGFALGALGVGIAIVLLVRPLQRRLGPALAGVGARDEEPA